MIIEQSQITIQVEADDTDDPPSHRRLFLHALILQAPPGMMRKA